ncbi:transketolase family protein [Micromonosporaceae bacterium Da 78-11]
MRTRFFADLTTAARADRDLMLISADIGFSVVEPFIEACPDQFLNVGVAEQNMASLAAGMALGGARVFTYSIANFPTLRCLEQIRNDIAYHHADVTVVAVGGGMAYGALGMSHHATEDLAIMRAIPGMAVAAPGDPAETGAVLADLVTNGGPAYLRLGKAGERTVHAEPLRLVRGESIALRSSGGTVALFSTGGILEVVCAAADLLGQAGVPVDVRSFPWVNPLDVVAVRDAAVRYEAIVTVEEHSVVGGFGSSVAEILAELPGAAPLIRIGLPNRSFSLGGDQDYLRAAHGLDPVSISRRVLDQLEANRGLASQIR